MSGSLGLYVHIPFCAKKCAYCDFPSFEGKMGLREEYVDRLVQEIVSAGEERGHPEADTAYIGGGTPTLLNPLQMQRVLAALKQAFRLAPDVEFSCEANPGMVSDAMLDVLAKGGVNRLSLGVQSANATELALLGRQHTWPQAVDAAVRARRAGFSNLNIDLMMGLPGQTVAAFRETLEAGLSLEPQHFSCYGLIVEEGTPFFTGVADGTLALPEEDEERAMYSLAMDRLTGAGLARYEVSNYARPGRSCRHNLNCWRRVPYLGFGAAAHSLMPDLAERRANPGDLTAYLAGQAAERTTLSPAEQRFESLMLGLRMAEGMQLDAFKAMHGVAFSEAFAAPLERALAKGTAELAEGAFRLTARGMDIMNTVLVDFMDERQ